ncbi:LysE family translocator [Haloglycomyces albus]|uniref:LysE family translocator n=1 Tax=Haloglycomyces albus TaxID=526067 RepID=UPI00046CFA4E|nr:LysE family translocator [Haloglycomyces albus]
MDSAAAVAFWVTSFLLVCTPGADWAYAISAGLRHRSVVPSVGGMLTGHLAATLVVAAGVGAFVAESPHALTWLTVAGAVYLLWLGATTFAKPAGPRTSGEPDVSSPWRQTFKGMGVSGLNPKVYLLFLAILPQFTDPSGPWPISVQIVFLGLIHIASCAVVYVAVGVGARRVLGTRPATAKVVSRASGLAMIGISVALIAKPLIA